MDRSTQAPRGGRVGKVAATALIAVLVVGALLASGGDVGAARARGKMTVGGVSLTVELATTPAAKARGLGYRARLQPGTGMLFVEEQAVPQAFWMKGMRFCIDIVWIEGGEVVGAAERVCPDAPGTPDEARRRYRSPGPVRYVLEVPAGWLDANGLGVGSPVKLPGKVA